MVSFRMLKSERRPVRTALRQLFWYSFQIAVVAFWLWVEWSRSQESGEPARPGLALVMGVGFAFVLSMMWLAAKDLVFRLRNPGVELRHVREPRENPDSLGTSGRQLGKPHKLLPGPRVRE